MRRVLRSNKIDKADDKLVNKLSKADDKFTKDITSISKRISKEETASLINSGWVNDNVYSFLFSR